MGSGWPQLSVLLFRGRVYFRSSCILEVPPGVGTWAGGGEGGGDGSGKWMAATFGFVVSPREIQQQQQAKRSRCVCIHVYTFGMGEGVGSG